MPPDNAMVDAECPECGHDGPHRLIPATRVVECTGCYIEFEADAHAVAAATTLDG